MMQIRQISCGENHTLALIDIVQLRDGDEDGLEDEESKEIGKEGTPGGADEQEAYMTKMFVWGKNDKK